MYVVVACAISLPSGPSKRPSAMAIDRPQWITRPSPRTSPVRDDIGRTKLSLISTVVWPAPAASLVKTASHMAESRIAMVKAPWTVPCGL